MTICTIVCPAAGVEASCTKGVTIHIGNHVIHMDQHHVLTIDNVQVTKLPFNDDRRDFKIYMVSSLFMKAELPNGITVLWDGMTRVYVTAPPSFINKTKGTTSRLK